VIEVQEADDAALKRDDAVGEGTVEGDPEIRHRLNPIGTNR
jgi:hypothetical protein